jgi:hypothetical protein
MKRMRRTLLVCATLAGCHGSSDGWSAVTGTLVDTYVTETGDVSQPWGPKAVKISAICPGPDAWTTIPGNIDESGRFTIPNVPSRDCFVRMDKQVDNSWPVFFLADVPHMVLGTVRLGRPEAEEAVQPTTLGIDADQMSAWAPDDELDLFSLGGGVSDYGIERSGSPIDVGATSLQGFSVDMSRLSNPHLVDGTRGDHLFVAHLTNRHPEVDPAVAKTSITYLAIAEVLRPEAPAQHDGQDSGVTGSFEAPGPATPIKLDLRMGPFYNEAKHVNPIAHHEGYTLAAYAEPAGPRRTSRGASPLLLFGDYVPKGGLPIDFPATASIANPYPSGWTPRLYAWSDYSVPFLPDNFRFTIGRFAPLTELAGQPLDWKITPPRQLTIDGIDVSVPGQHGGPTSVLRWQAPPEGARSYMVEVYRQDASGQWPLVAVLGTDQTSLRFPPGVLDNAAPWVASVTAFDNQALDAPNTPPPRGAYATAVTAVLVP